MNRYKLTPFAKGFLSIIVLIVIAGITYIWAKSNPEFIPEPIAKILKIEKQEIIYTQQAQIENNQLPETNVQTKAEIAQTNSTNTNNPIINLSLDEWIGWKPIIDANGGTETVKGSIYDQLGIKVSIKIINDATLSSTAMIKGDLNAAGYTLNRLAFLMDKFERSNVRIVVPYVSNNSFGGDGVIARQGINSIEQLVGKKIVVPRYSEAQTLVWWLLKNSSLTNEQISRIQNDMILVDTPDAAAKVFFANQADAAATWQPYLSQANDPNSGATLLFSTKNASNLILDVIAFRKDFYEDNLEIVSKFIEGALKAHSMYTEETKYVKNTMPQMADISKQDLKDMAADADLSDYARNLDILSANGLGLAVFNDMADIWRTIGENVPNKNYSTIFDISALKMLDGKFSTVKATTVTFTEEQKQSVKANVPLMTKRVSIEFDVNTAKYKDVDKAIVILREIAEQCNIADGMILQIEGNTSSEGAYEYNKKLSYDRAKAVANTLKAFGVDPSRFIIEGNGPDNPIAPNSTVAGREINRRTDIYFKPVN